MRLLIKEKKIKLTKKEKLYKEKTLQEKKKPTNTQYLKTFLLKKNELFI